MGKGGGDSLENDKEIFLLLFRFYPLIFLLGFVFSAFVFLFIRFGFFFVFLCFLSSFGGRFVRPWP